MLEEKFNFNIGDLVEVVDIGEGTPLHPWTEAPVPAIYMGSYEANRHFGFDPGSNMSILAPETWHIVWYRGRKRYISKSIDLKLLSSHNI